jgi:hypothetical protein
LRKLVEAVLGTGADRLIDRRANVRDSLRERRARVGSGAAAGRIETREEQATRA